MLPSSNYHLGKQRQQEHLAKAGLSEQELLKRGRSISSASPKLSQLGKTIVGLILIGYTVTRILNPSNVTTLEVLDLTEPEQREIYEGVDPLEPVI